MDFNILSFFDCVDINNNKVIGTLRTIDNKYYVVTTLRRFNIYVQNVVMNGKDFEADLISYEK